MNKKPISHAQLMANAWSQAAAWNLMYPTDVNVRVAGSTKKELAHGGSAFVIGNGVAVCTIVGRDGPVDLDSLEMLPESGEYPVACEACEPMLIREPDEALEPAKHRIDRSLLQKVAAEIRFEFPLGSILKFRYAAFRGRVIGRAEYLYCENKYLLVPETAHDNTAPNGTWAEVGELELVELPKGYFEPVSS